MPIYEYVCNDCSQPFEKLVMKFREKIVCPSCGGRHHTQQYSVIASPAKSGGDSGMCGSGAGMCEMPGGGGGGCCGPSGCGCN